MAAGGANDFFFGFCIFKTFTSQRLGIAHELIRPCLIDVSNYRENYSVDIRSCYEGHAISERERHRDRQSDRFYDEAASFSIMGS